MNQAPRRAAERGARRGALAYCRWRRRRGARWAEVSGELEVAARTLRHWQRGWQTDRLASRPRGRPLARAARQARNAAIEILVERGASVSAAELRRRVPELGRNEAAELKRRWRHIERLHRLRVGYELAWKAGAVWAADYTAAPRPVEGRYPGILAIRDLGSGKGLEVLAAEAQDGATAAGALQALFVRHGAPLVIKTDNGSPFTGKRVGELLETWRVTLLLSPPATPAYNGALEAGIGGIKTRAHHLAAAAGRAGRWTCDDLEAARRIGNANAAWGPCPDERWENRQPVRRDERESFRKALSSARARVQSMQPDPMTYVERNRCERQAISLALREHGTLQLKRRRKSPPVSSKIMAGIS